MARVLKGEKLEQELLRLEQMKAYEQEYQWAGLVCGIDEAGRGPLAGPVVAGAVILPADCRILYLNDSKKLSEKRREELFLEIKEKAVSWAVGIASPEEIERNQYSPGNLSGDETGSGAAKPSSRRAVKRRRYHTRTAGKPDPGADY